MINPLTKTQASVEQTYDLLNFRHIGEKEFLLRIAYFILKVPSVNAPNRKRRLITFSEKKKTQRVSQLERDKKLILLAMRKKMNHSQRTGRPIAKAGEQLIVYPLAICKEGMPLKGSKSYTTHSLEARYKGTTVFTTQPPWKPQCCLMEGMFLINTTPLGVHKTLSDYAKFLTRRFVVTQFNQGCQEVHVIFDNPGSLPKKYFEHMRRDLTAKVSTDHYCDDLNGSSKIPKGKWREGLLNCRSCKRKLVIFLGKYFLSNIKTFLQPQQTLYVAGAFEGDITDTAWSVQGTDRQQPQPEYTSNSEETDTRIWLHAQKPLVQGYC